MSGICGIVALAGTNPTLEQLRAMSEPLERRGPDGTGHWLGGPAALGHTLLATTPEALVERLPLTEPESGCTITADVRLDNREELLPALGLSDEDRTIGDGELILRAYLRWGQGCLDHFFGDFAFAIWDPRMQRLFCGRDQMGMRQLIYCHISGQLFAFATEPRALLMHPGVPHRINRGRVADYFVGYLEGIDFTSTFFEELHRLPPAHSLTLDSSGLSIHRYWTLQPGPQLELESDEAYAQAFLEVFTKAVKCRLRSPDPPGSMLSGGMDSGSVVAVASRLLAEEGRGPLKTFSGVGPEPETCVETRSIHAALMMPGLDPQLVSYAELGDYVGDLIRLIRECDEPFDGNWVLNRAVYLAAQRSGVKVMLDGGAGDVSLGHGDWLARLLRAGKLAEFRRELKGETAFWGFSTARMGVAYAASAFAPEWMRSIKQKVVRSLRRFRLVHRSAMHPDFAQKVDLAARLNAFQQTYPKRRLSFPFARAHVITHTYLAVGRERCDRVASALAIEPRDPFIDLRVIDFCLALPGRQLVREGWPKWILRQAMAGLLPDAVRWRRGKEHLGATFRGSLMDQWTDWPGLASEDELVLANIIKADGESLAQRTQQNWFQVILGHWLANVRRSAGVSVDAQPSNRV